MISPVVEVYTDGSCLKNPGPGGMAYLIKFQEEKDNNEIANDEFDHAESYRYTTNNRMEIMAAIAAIKHIINLVENDSSWKEIQQIHIFSDSEYLCNAINKKWLETWNNNHWMTKGFRGSEPTEVKNKDLWSSLVELQSILRALSITLIITWVKGHDNNPDNERVDKLARDIALSGDNSQVDEYYEKYIQEHRKY